MPTTRNARASTRPAKRQRCLEELDAVRPSKAAREALTSDQTEAQPCSSSPGQENAPADAQSAESSPVAATISCRTQETERLHGVLRSSLTDGQGVAVYIPGQPGTGKTHTVRKVLQHLPYKAWGAEAPAVALINCTARKRCTLGKVVLAALHDAAAHNRSRGAPRSAPSTLHAPRHCVAAAARLAAPPLPEHHSHAGGSTAQLLHVSSGGQNVEAFALPGGGKVSSDEGALRHLREFATGGRTLCKVSSSAPSV